MSPRPDLVDLRSLTEHWRVRRDEEGLPVIPGRRGHVSAHDLTTLSAYIANVFVLRRTLRQLPQGWRRYQVGDAEANLLAPLSDLDVACDLIRAYRRRRLSETQRAKAVRRLLAIGPAVAGHFRGQSGGSKPRINPVDIPTASGPENPPELTLTPGAGSPAR